MSSSRRTPAGSSSPGAVSRRPTLGLADAIRASGRSPPKSGSTLLAVSRLSPGGPSAPQRGRSQPLQRTDSDTGSNADSSASDSHSNSSLRARFAARRSTQRRLRRTSGEPSSDPEQPRRGSIPHPPAAEHPPRSSSDNGNDNTDVAQHTSPPPSPLPSGGATSESSRSELEQRLADLQQQFARLQAEHARALNLQAAHQPAASETGGAAHPPQPRPQPTASSSVHKLRGPLSPPFEHIINFEFEHPTRQSTATHLILSLGAFNRMKPRS